MKKITTVDGLVANICVDDTGGAGGIPTTTSSADYDLVMEDADDIVQTPLVVTHEMALEKFKFDFSACQSLDDFARCLLGVTTQISRINNMWGCIRQPAGRTLLSKIAKLTFRFLVGN